MWQGYVTAIEEFIADCPEIKAELVIDRFHVAKSYRTDFDNLRKQEMRRLKKTLSEEEYRQVVVGTMWILRHNHKHLEQQARQRLRMLFNYSPRLHQAYTLREELTAIFDSALTRKQAEKRLQRWILKVKRSSTTCYDSFLATLKRHFNGIVHYFSHRANSGFVEGFNNKLRVITRRCFGIRKLCTLVRRLRLDVRGY